MDSTKHSPDLQVRFTAHEVQNKHEFEQHKTSMLAELSRAGAVQSQPEKLTIEEWVRFFQRQVWVPPK